MEIRNTTVYTLDTLYAFNKNYLKQRKGIWIIYGALTVVIVLMFALHLYTSFVYGDGKIDPAMIYLLSFAVIVDVLYILMYTVILKHHIKKSPQLDARVECTFTADSIIEKAVTKTTEHNTVSSYDAVYKVTQDEKFLYVFIAQNAACIIDKNGFTEGDLDSLIALLKVKVAPLKIRL